MAVFSSSTYLAASPVLRGPVALNVLLFYTGTMDLGDPELRHEEYGRLGLNSLCRGPEGIHIQES